MNLEFVLWVGWVGDPYGESRFQIEALVCSIWVLVCVVYISLKYIA